MTLEQRIGVESTLRGRRATLAVLLSAVASGLAATSAPAGGRAQTAERRVALVIGNSAYRSVTPLVNPGTDARLIASVVLALGFELVGNGPLLDLDRNATVQAIGEFGDALRPGTIALFYYSGHGLQVDGVNYLVPVDARPTKLSDVDSQMVDAGAALAAMEHAGTSLNLFVLDACRNNPFDERGLRTPGLAEMHAPHGTIISYATQPGGVASDGEKGSRDSPYTSALATALRTPGLEIVRAFNQVGLAVSRATHEQQEPWLALSPLDRETYLAGRTPSVGTVTPAPADSASGESESRSAHMARKQAEKAQAEEAQGDKPAPPKPKARCSGAPSTWWWRCPGE